MQNNKQATIIRRAFLKIMGKQNNTDLHQRKKVEMQELKKSYQTFMKKSCYHQRRIQNPVKHLFMNIPNRIKS